ncbi:MAG: response regulator [Pseudoxanthomonas sp.]
MSQTIAGKTLLLVEDDTLVAATVEDILLYAEAAHVQVASSVDQALQVLAEKRFDAAIVDIDLNGQASWPVAAELKRRQIPYLTVSGYRDMVQHELIGALLPKPYSMNQLLSAVSALL